MKAIVTVIGKDQVGIIQTVMQEYFTMMMVVDTAQCAVPFDALAADLADYGQNRGLSVRIQREDIFNAMHKI